RTHEQRAQTLTQLSAITAGLTPLGPRPLVSLSTGTAGQAPVLLQRREQKLTTPAEVIEWRLDLRATETSYRVVVFDEYTFASKTGTVRAIKVEPEPSPTIVLHPERWPVSPAFKSKAKTAQVLDFE